MKKQAREKTMASSWDAVFDSVYKAYAECIGISEEKRREAESRKTKR